MSNNQDNKHDEQPDPVITPDPAEPKDPTPGTEPVPDPALETI